ncbi:MAG: DUF2240 family protein [Thermoplasmatales archaeon]|jgi:hypothetical protein|nr:DUF2240 family protein [Candidatus Thermoplasmatota archaeon]MCL6002839.1 DUF2240 family protein [Candidatus Thermoplasmatota archaeon]MDA8054299.1 DUF2240 family protein [Thermoplasmatales archaeon]
MVEEIRKLLLYLKKTTGKYEFSETEILTILSIKTRYLTPDQVKEFLRIAVEARCLKQSDSMYSITCSINGIELSLDYKPDFDAIMNEKDGTDVTETVISLITEKTSLSKRDIISEINKMREKNPFLSPKVAALVVARLNGVDVERFLLSA